MKTTKEHLLKFYKEIGDLMINTKIECYAQFGRSEGSTYLNVVFFDNKVSAECSNFEILLHTIYSLKKNQNNCEVIKDLLSNSKKFYMYKEDVELGKELKIKFHVKDTKDDNNNYHSSSSNILFNN